MHKSKEPENIVTPKKLIRINLQAANGKFICCQMGLKGLLTANIISPSTWELFKMADLGNGTVALKGVNNKYVTVLSDDKNILAAQSEQITRSETFEIVHLTDSTIALKAFNGYYVRCDTGNYNKLFASGLATQANVTMKMVRYDF